GNLNLNGNGNVSLNGNLNANLNKAINESTNTNTSTNTNHNTNTSDTHVNVDVGLDLSGYAPSNRDVTDVKLDNGSRIDQMLVNHDGQIFYNPGDGASFNDFLNGSLNGEGNDTAVSLAQINNLSDND